MQLMMRPDIVTELCVISPSVRLQNAWSRAVTSLPVRGRELDVIVIPTYFFASFVLKVCRIDSAIILVVEKATISSYYGNMYSFSLMRNIIVN